MDISFIEPFWKNGGTFKNLASLVLSGVISVFAKPLSEAKLVPNGAWKAWEGRLTWGDGHAFSLGQAELRIMTRYLAEKDGGMWKGRSGL